MGNCIITGGTGLLGQAIYHSRLNEITNSPIKILTRQQIAHKSNFIQTNYSQKDVARIREEVGDIDFVIHCVGRPSVFLSLKEPAEDHFHNFNPLLFSLELARIAKAKIIYFSSVEVYGYEKDEQRIETTIPNPQNFYACNKLFGENYVKLYHKTFGLDYLILRPGIFIGETIKKSIVFEFINAYHQRRTSVPIYCTLDSKLDFIHVKEVAHALCFLTQKKIQNEIYNIGSNKAFLVSELQNFFNDTYAFSPELNMLDNEYLYKTVPMQKLLTAGWQPQVKIEQRIMQIVENFHKC